MKLDLGELILSQYKESEVLESLANNLATCNSILSKAVKEGDLGTIGICSARISDCAQIAKALNERTNGKKTATVL